MASPYPAYNPGNFQSTAANAIPVYVTTGGGGTTIGAVSRYAGTWTDRSGTITTANVSQTLMAANSIRKAFYLQNTSSVTLYINFTSNASTGGGSVQVPAGGTYTDPPEFVTTEQINILATTAGASFVAKEGN